MKMWLRYLLACALFVVLLIFGGVQVDPKGLASATAPVRFRAFLPSTSAPQRPDEPISPLPEGAPWPQLDPRIVDLGRRLFHDTRLSGDNTVSCATCHPLEKGGADGLPRSLGVGGALGSVNAPSVLTAAFNFRQFWDGRAGTLEEQAGGPVLNPVEMASNWPQVIDRLGADPAIKRLFAQLYPSGLTPENIRSALADFERSLPQPSRFDRWLRGDDSAITAAELAGYQLFKRHGCAACHQGINVGGNLYQRFGIMEDYFSSRAQIAQADLGRYNVTRNEQDRHLFKVPSLRNVALTAPYFHDASTPFLEQAVAIMGRYQLGVALPDGDVALIVDFLKSLTAERL
jgi:cytochrome c peroxidase